MSVTEMRDALNAEIEKGNGNKEVKIYVETWPNPLGEVYYPQEVRFDNDCGNVEVYCEG